jgi:hypothetical protein
MYSPQAIPEPVVENQEIKQIPFQIYSPEA